ncbi:MAG: RNA polymerase sigma factor [bacterium]
MANDQHEADANAVARCRQGDREAFGVLVRRYQALAVSVAFSICRERSLAEDVAQDAFVRAYRQLDQLSRPRAFCAWLMHIVRNRALRVTHNVARRREVHEEATADQEPHTENPTVSMEVAELLERLDDQARQILTHKYVHGMTCKEIANRLDVPIGTVTSKISRSLRRLRSSVRRERRRAGLQEPEP